MKPLAILARRMPHWRMGVALGAHALGSCALLGSINIWGMWVVRFTHEADQAWRVYKKTKQQGGHHVK